MPKMENVRVRPTLTNLSLGYANQEFIADRIFPIVPRDTDTGEFYGSGMEMFTREQDVRGLKDAPTRSTTTTASSPTRPPSTLCSKKSRSSS